MLGKNIKELRVEKGLSQAQLAERVGVTQGAIYFWEKGINEPTAGYLVKLAQVFSVSIDELLSFDCHNAGETETKTGEMIKVFSKLSMSQQDALINMAEEFLKK